MTTASDLARPCLVVDESTKVGDVLRKVELGQVCAVVDANRKLKGILTESDLVRLIYEPGQFDQEVMVAGHMPAFLGMSLEQLRALSVTELMTTDPDGVSPEAPLEELVQLMFRNRRKVVLVVRDGRLEGAVHRMDVVKKVLA